MLAGQLTTTKICFLQFWRVQVPVCPISAEVTLLDRKRLTSCNHTWQKQCRRDLGVSSCANPPPRALPYDLTACQRPHLLIPFFRQGLCKDENLRFITEFLELSMGWLAMQNGDLTFSRELEMLDGICIEDFYLDRVRH